MKHKECWPINHPASIDDGKIILSQGKDDILDRYALVQIDKEVMTDALRVELIGVKETAFKFSGLCIREKLRNVTGV
ncbi:hypothetical protein [Candidatus Contubernalis alkaliaceticus]|uniref:hypothetical protein n=1 Tax=Candidatus Contubernalis alkaliaceticus TaxID=338645 RepID=UPI001F4C2ACE|nr:hypothetical protein [Candidatus Contubernalis alkalaceticus]UNC93233.1 hypothetical protein HUE98_14735 [Candidatus Contubernalis alkalaceticus]